MKTSSMIFYVVAVVLAFSLAYRGMSDSPIAIAIFLPFVGALLLSQVIIDHREASLSRLCKSRSPIPTEEWIHRYYSMREDKNAIICVVLDICGEAFGITPSTRMRPTDCLAVNYGWLATLVLDDVPGVIVEEIHCTLEQEFPREWQPPLEITTLDALITSVVTASWKVARQ